MNNIIKTCTDQSTPNDSGKFSESRLFDLARKGGGWQSLVSLIRALAGIIFTGVTLRTLGFENAGIAWTIIGINQAANAFLSLGTITTTTQFLSSPKHSPETLHRAVNECLGYIFVSGGVWVIVLVLASPYITSAIAGNGIFEVESSTAVLIIFGVYGVLFRLFMAITSFLRARQDYRSSAIAWLSYDLLAVTTTAVAVTIMPKLVVFSLTLLVVVVVSILFAGVSLSRCYGFFPIPVPSVSPVTRFWTFGRWVYGNEVFASLANGMDRFALSSLFSPAFLPFYLFPRKFYETIHNLFSNQASFLFTIFSSLDSESRRSTAMEVRKLRLIWSYALLGAFSYGILLFFADGFLRLIAPDKLGNEFFPYLYLFSLIGYFQSLTVPLFHLCYAEKRPKPILVFSLINGVGSVAVLYVLANWFGFFEACLSQAIIAVTSIGFVYREIKLGYSKQAFYQFTVASAVPSALFITAIVLSLKVRTYSSGFLLMGLVGIVYAIAFCPVALWLERLFFGRNSGNLALVQRLVCGLGMSRPVFRPILKLLALA